MLHNLTESRLLRFINIRFEEGLLILEMMDFITIKLCSYWLASWPAPDISPYPMSIRVMRSDTLRRDIVTKCHKHSSNNFEASALRMLMRKFLEDVINCSLCSSVYCSLGPAFLRWLRYGHGWTRVHPGERGGKSVATGARPSLLRHKCTPAPALGLTLTSEHRDIT